MGALTRNPSTSPATARGIAELVGSGLGDYLYR